MFLNQGCSHICINNENYMSTIIKSVHHLGDLVEFQVLIAIYIVDVLHKTGLLF